MATMRDVFGSPFSKRSQARLREASLPALPVRVIVSGSVMAALTWLAVGQVIGLAVIGGTLPVAVGAIYAHRGRATDRRRVRRNEDAR